MAKKDLNLRISELLKQKGITQRMLASQMEVSPAYITNLLHGRSLSLNALIKIAECLDVEVYDLFNAPQPKSELENLTKKTLERMLRFPEHADLDIASELMYNLYKTMDSEDWHHYFRSTIHKLLPVNMTFEHLLKFISEEEYKEFMESL